MNYERGLNIKNADNERKFRERCLKNAERRAMKDAAKQETKTERVCIMMSPSMVKKIQDKATCLGLNLSDYIRNLIEEDLKNENICF